jgi:hypothetical protein
MMDKKYIDRDALIRHLHGECAAKYPTTFLGGLTAAASEVRKFPLADVVEVVRCKDCKYYVTDPYNNGDVDENVCTEQIIWASVPPDGFCNYGERKDDNG